MEQVQCRQRNARQKNLNHVPDSLLRHFPSSARRRSGLILTSKADTTGTSPHDGETMKRGCDETRNDKESGNTHIGNRRSNRIDSGAEQ